MKIGKIVNINFENYTSGNFWNNFEINFKVILKNTAVINRTLECIGQGQFKFDQLLSTYETVDSRNGIIFMAKDCRTGKLEKIIIDGMYGGPSVKQIKELTYMVGRDCDKRIILYTHDQLKRVGKFRYEDLMVEQFALMNNDCNVETYIVRVDDRENGFDLMNIKLNSILNWRGSKRIKFETQYSFEEFEKAEFEVYYLNDSQDRYYDIVVESEKWAGLSWHLEVGDIYFRFPIWTKEGLFMQGISQSSTGDSNLEALMNEKRHLINKFFDNRDLRFDVKVLEKIDFPASGKVLTIKMCDQPFSTFVRASTEEKIRMVDVIRGYEGTIMEFWDNIIGRPYEDKPIEALGVIPQFSCIIPGCCLYKLD